MNTRRRHWLRLGCSLLLLASALTYGSQAAYLSAKAQLAQVLLKLAWERSQASDAPIRPWPWADTHAAALLDIPRLGVRQVVLDSHSGEAMAFGPGLVTVGDSHVLGGHRDSHLQFLEHIESGDTLHFTTADGNTTSYVIEQLQIVNASTSPQYTPAPQSLTLITCYPFNALGTGGPLRLVVIAYRRDERTT